MYKHKKKINKMIGGKSQEEKIKSMFETLIDLEKTIETRKKSKSQTKEQKKKLKSVKDAFDTQLDNLKKSINKYYISVEGKGSNEKTSISNLLQTNIKVQNFFNRHIKNNTSIPHALITQNKGNSLTRSSSSRRSSINSNNNSLSTFSSPNSSSNSSPNSLTLSPETYNRTYDNNNISSIVITPPPLSELNSNNPMVPIYQNKKLPPYSRVPEIRQQTQKQDILRAKFNTMAQTHSILSSKTKHSKRNDITECKKENRVLKANLQELSTKNEQLIKQLNNLKRSQHQKVLNNSTLKTPRRSPLKSGNENIVLNNHSISSPVVPTPTPPPAPVLPISPVPSSSSASASVLSSNNQKSKSICELLKNN